MIFIQLSEEQLNQMMQSAVREGIAQAASINTSQSLLDVWLSIEELRDYLPGKPAITTLYGKVQRREIPFKRMGKRLVFLRSEIDHWLKGQHRRASTEISTSSEQYLSSTRKRS